MANENVAELERLLEALVPVVATVEHEYHTDPDVTGVLWDKVEYVRGFHRWVENRLKEERAKAEEQRWLEYGDFELDRDFD